MKKITIDVPVVALAGVLIVLLFALLIGARMQVKDLESKQQTSKKTTAQKTSNDTSLWCNPFTGSCVRYPSNATIKPPGDTGVTAPLGPDHPAAAISTDAFAVSLTTIPDGDSLKADCVNNSPSDCSFKTTIIEDTAMDDVQLVCGVESRGSLIDASCFAIAIAQLQTLSLQKDKTSELVPYRPVYESPAPQAGDEVLIGSPRKEFKSIDQAAGWLQGTEGRAMRKIMQSLYANPDAVYSPLYR